VFGRLIAVVVLVALGFGVLLAGLSLVSNSISAPPAITEPLHRGRSHAGADGTKTSTLQGRSSSSAGHAPQHPATVGGPKTSSSGT
jgi:hypothetical protein